MKSLVLSLITCVSLSGCLYQTADSFDLHRSIVFCGSAENIAKMTVYALGAEEVTCMDQKTTLLHLVKMEEK